MKVLSTALESTLAWLEAHDDHADMAWFSDLGALGFAAAGDHRRAMDMVEARTGNAFFDVLIYKDRYLQRYVREEPRYQAWRKRIEAGWVKPCVCSPNSSSETWCSGPWPAWRQCLPCGMGSISWPRNSARESPADCDGAVGVDLRRCVPGLRLSACQGVVGGSKLRIWGRFHGQGGRSAGLLAAARAVSRRAAVSAVPTSGPFEEVGDAAGAV